MRAFGHVEEASGGHPRPELGFDGIDGLARELGMHLAVLIEQVGVYQARADGVDRDAVPAISSATHLVNPTTPCLDTFYADWLRDAHFPAVEATLTIFP